MRDANRKRGRDEREREHRRGGQRRPREERGSQNDRAGRGGRGGGIVSEALQYVRNGAQAASRQIQQTLGDTTGAVLDTVLEEAERLYEQQRKTAVSRVSSLSKIAARSAHALHAVKADGVAEYVEHAAKQVERSTRYLRDRELAEILQDAGDVIRRNPAAAMGGMFLVGFAVTRFLKASASRDGQGGDEGGEGEPRAIQKRRQRH